MIQCLTLFMDHDCCIMLRQVRGQDFQRHLTNKQTNFDLHFF